MKLHLVALRHGPCLMGSHSVTCHSATHTFYTHKDRATPGNQALYVCVRQMSRTGRIAFIIRLVWKVNSTSLTGVNSLRCHMTPSRILTYFFSAEVTYPSNRYWVFLFGIYASINRYNIRKLGIGCISLESNIWTNISCKNNNDVFNYVATHNITRDRLTHYSAY